mmetsp:Transcript_22247/g.56155  ORF Transcript_22247/g.56155 Transcript_22247/m.56155 type:complete len:1423 (-) Transcript_22247:302-4570(-)
MFSTTRQYRPFKMPPRYRKRLAFSRREAKLLTSTRSFFFHEASVGSFVSAISAGPPCNASTTNNTTNCLGVHEQSRQLLSHVPPTLTVRMAYEMSSEDEDLSSAFRGASQQPPTRAAEVEQGPLVLAETRQDRGKSQSVANVQLPQEPQERLTTGRRTSERGSVQAATLLLPTLLATPMELFPKMMKAGVRAESEKAVAASAQDNKPKKELMDHQTDFESAWRSHYSTLEDGPFRSFGFGATSWSPTSAREIELDYQSRKMSPRPFELGLSARNCKREEATASPGTHSRSRSPCRQTRRNAEERSSSRSLKRVANALVCSGVRSDDLISFGTATSATAATSCKSPSPKKRSGSPAKHGPLAPSSSASRVRSRSASVKRKARMNFVHMNRCGLTSSFARNSQLGPGAGGEGVVGEPDTSDSFDDSNSPAAAAAACKKAASAPTWTPSTPGSKGMTTHSSSASRQYMQTRPESPVSPTEILILQPDEKSSASGLGAARQMLGLHRDALAQATPSQKLRGPFSQLRLAPQSPDWRPLVANSSKKDSRGGGGPFAGKKRRSVRIDDQAVAYSARGITGGAVGRGAAVLSRDHGEERQDAVDVVVSALKQRHLLPAVEQELQEHAARSGCRSSSPLRPNGSGPQVQPTFPTLLTASPLQQCGPGVDSVGQNLLPQWSAGEVMGTADELVRLLGIPATDEAKPLEAQLECDLSPGATNQPKTRGLAPAGDAALCEKSRPETPPLAEAPRAEKSRMLRSASSAAVGNASPPRSREARRRSPAASDRAPGSSKKELIEKHRQRLLTSRASPSGNRPPTGLETRVAFLNSKVLTDDEKRSRAALLQSSQRSFSRNRGKNAPPPRVELRKKASEKRGNVAPPAMKTNRPGSGVWRAQSASPSSAATESKRKGARLEDTAPVLVECNKAPKQDMGENQIPHDDTRQDDDKSDRSRSFQLSATQSSSRAGSVENNEAFQTCSSTNEAVLAGLGLVEPEVGKEIGDPGETKQVFFDEAAVTPNGATPEASAEEQIRQVIVHLSPGARVVSTSSRELGEASESSCAASSTNVLDGVQWLDEYFLEKTTVDAPPKIEVDENGTSGIVVEEVVDDHEDVVTYDSLSCREEFTAPVASCGEDREQESESEPVAGTAERMPATQRTPAARDKRPQDVRSANRRQEKAGRMLQTLRNATSSLRSATAAKAAQYEAAALTTPSSLKKQVRNSNSCRLPAPGAQLESSINSKSPLQVFQPLLSPGLLEAAKDALAAPASASVLKKSKLVLPGRVEVALKRRAKIPSTSVIAPRAIGVDPSSMPEAVAAAMDSPLLRPTTNAHTGQRAVVRSVSPRPEDVSSPRGLRAFPVLSEASMKLIDSRGKWTPDKRLGTAARTLFNDEHTQTQASEPQRQARCQLRHNIFRPQERVEQVELEEVGRKRL